MVGTIKPQVSWNVVVVTLVGETSFKGPNHSTIDFPELNKCICISSALF